MKIVHLLDKLLLKRDFMDKMFSPTEQVGVSMVMILLLAAMGVIFGKIPIALTPYLLCFIAGGVTFYAWTLLAQRITQKRLEMDKKGGGQ